MFGKEFFVFFFVFGIDNTVLARKELIFRREKNTFFARKDILFVVKKNKEKTVLI